MKKLNRKGFTIVELVIVIAVIAILSAVLIPTISSLIKTAQTSADITLVKNVNLILATERATEGKNATMQDALEDVFDGGYDIKKLSPTNSDNFILWDQESDNFVLYADGEYNNAGAEVSVDTNALYKLWNIYTEMPEAQTYSIYWNGGDLDVANVSVGFDAGTSAVATVNYATDAAQNAIIRTNNGTLTVEASNATVNHYGEADEVYVNAVSENTFNLFGKVGYIEVAADQHVVLKTGSKANAIYAPDADIDVENGQSNDIVVTEGNKESVKFGATLFAGGLGTAEAPYLIETAEQLQNIGANYDNYAYYKVANGVKSIDCSNWTRVNLNGSFNGNGVVLNGVDSVLFNNVGSGADGKAVVIENFTVKFEAGAGIARVCATPNLTFKNVTATGYLIEDWNGAVFLRYGTENFDDSGFDYEVNFEHCASTAEIYSTTNAYSSILVGHAYQGAGHTATINVDKATDTGINETTLYYTGTDKVPFGYKYYGHHDGAAVVVKVDGNDADKGKITGESIVAVLSNKTPVKENGVWGITTEADVTKVVINLTWQYTLYTENYGAKIEGENGVGGIIGDAIVIEVANGEAIQALDKIESIEIKSGADKWDYEIVNGKLTLYMPSTNQYVDGNLYLTIEQYTGGSSIAKYTGRVLIASKTTSADFIIK